MNRLLGLCLIFSIALHLLLLKNIPFALPQYKLDIPIEVDLKFLPSSSSPKKSQAKVRKVSKPKIKFKSKPKPESKPLKEIKLKMSPQKAKPQSLKTSKASSKTLVKNAKANTLEKKLLTAYLNSIYLKIEKHKEYPFWARRHGIEGRVIVVFSLKRNGQLKEINVEESSGYSLLDKAAIKTIKRAAPFPAFPPELNKKIITLRIPICFYLN